MRTLNKVARACKQIIIDLKFEVSIHTIHIVKKSDKHIVLMIIYELAKKKIWRTLDVLIFYFSVEYS